MTALLIGLAIFLGTHSSRIFADPMRSRLIAARGEGSWKGVYAALSLTGFALIIWGFGQARAEVPIVLWTVPNWAKHAAALLTMPAFVLVAASYVSGTHIKARVGHPMVLGVKLWAFAHLVANGTLAEVVLFGSFFVWAVVLYIASRRRDRLANTRLAPGRLPRDLIAIAVGSVGWAVFAFALHRVLIGVGPFG